MALRYSHQPRQFALASTAPVSSFQGLFGCARQQRSPASCWGRYGPVRGPSSNRIWVWPPCGRMVSWRRRHPSVYARGLLPAASPPARGRRGRGRRGV